ncbi:MAG: hypothetical protein JWM95_5370 [Gemmatimonadetes bacterium]|nr:hypothetical protein [Gemmatimonadota bacterium]
MRAETVPVILGVLVAIVGLAILADAWLPETMTFGSERRRRSRTERSLGGEACIGLAALCEAAALIGRDTWAYETVAMLAGAGLFVIGVWLNRRFLSDRISNRGALRRDETPKARDGKDRIR